MPKNNKQLKEEKMAKLKIEFPPNATPKEIVKYAKDWIFVFKTMQKLTGENPGNSIQQMEKIIKKYEK